MSKDSGEIHALLNLIEDPDEFVYESVKSRFIGMGESMIPILKEQLDFTQDLWIAKKIELIIFTIINEKISFQLENKKIDEANLLDTSINLSQLIDFEIDKESLFFEFDKIKRSIWLELNDYLTPLEEVNIFNKIIFSYYKTKGKTVSHKTEDDFSIQKLLIQKSGNSYPIGCLYLTLAHQLNIPLKAISIPKQNLIAYCVKQSNYSGESKDVFLFYIDPLTGQVYTQKDIDNYIKKVADRFEDFQIEIKSNKDYILSWLEEIANCEKIKGDDEKYKILKKTIQTLNDK